jgi:hypothetical protein
MPNSDARTEHRITAYDSWDRPVEILFAFTPQKKRPLVECIFAEAIRGC